MLTSGAKGGVPFSASALHSSAWELASAVRQLSTPAHSQSLEADAAERAILCSISNHDSVIQSTGDIPFESSILPVVSSVCPIISWWSEGSLSDDKITLYLGVQQLRSLDKSFYRVSTVPCVCFSYLIVGRPIIAAGCAVSDRLGPL